MTQAQIQNDDAFIGHPTYSGIITNFDSARTADKHQVS